MIWLVVFNDYLKTLEQMLVNFEAIFINKSDSQKS